MAYRRKVNVAVAHPHPSEVEEPHSRSHIVEPKAVSLLRGAAHVIVFQEHLLRDVGHCAVFITTRTYRVVLVLVTRVSSGQVHCERRGYLVSHAKFHALVGLIDTGKHIVHESGILVVIESGALGIVVDIGPKTSERTLEPAVVERIGYVARQDTCAAQAGYGIILDARRDVRLLECRSLGAVCRMQVETVATVNLVGDAGLEHGIVELVHNALAVGVLGRASVAHLAVALELRVAHAETIVYVPVRQVYHILQPSVGRDGVDIVVISETVAFAHAAVGVVKVVLQQYAIPCTLFVPPGLLGLKANDEKLLEHACYKNEDMMSVEDLHEWSKNGFEVGFHTNEHIDLSVTDISVQTDDFIQGISKLRELGYNPDKFAYPFGRLPKDYVGYEKLLLSNGIKYAYTLWPGDANIHNSLLINRICLGDYTPLWWNVLKTIGLVDRMLQRKCELSQRPECVICK